MKNLAPYVFKAWLEWLGDNQLTPVVVVNKDYPGVIMHPELPNTLLVTKDNTVAGELGLRVKAGVLDFFLPWPSFLLSAKQKPEIEFWFNISKPKPMALITDKGRNDE